MYVSIARKQIRLRRHPVHPTRCTLRHTRFRRVSRYDEVVLLPLGRLNKAIGAGRPPNPPPYVRSVRKRKLQLRVNGGNTKPRLFPEYLTRPATGNCSNFAHIKIKAKLPATFRTGFARIFSFQEEGEASSSSPPSRNFAANFSRELAQQPCNERQLLSGIEGTKGGELCGELSPHWKTSS